MQTICTLIGIMMVDHRIGLHAMFIGLYEDIIQDADDIDRLDLFIGITLFQL